jgi:hypothetical protein
MVTLKLPSDRFTVTLHILQGYLEVQDEQNLPQLWHHLANCTKKQDFNVLSDNLQAYARGPDAFSSMAPIASAKLVQDLLNFSFVSENTDDIKSGIQPFLVIDSTAEHQQANLKIAQTYGLLQAGDQSVMLADLQALQAKEVLAVPVTYFDLERNLGMFGNLLGTTLGSAHTLTITYRDFWKLLSLSYRQELQQVIDIKRHIKPVHVLRSVQVICHNWFTQRRAQLTLPRPDFTAILHNIALSTYILPHLPPTLYRLAYPKPLPMPAPSLTSISTSSGSGTAASTNSSGGSGGSTSGSVISALTMPTALGSQQRVSHVINLSPDLTLTQLIEPGVKIRDLIGSDPPPLLDNGQQVCLSHLLRQGCWSDCRRASTHNHVLTAAKKARIAAYINTQSRKLCASGQPASGTPAPGSATPP